MVEIVPPRDRVVEVEGVADDVDEEGRDEQDVERVRVRPRTSGEPPAERDDDGSERIEDEPPAERLALELVEPGEGAEGEQPDERDLEGDVEPEEPWTARRRECEPRISRNVSAPRG